jgi:hypothetical protein
MFFSLLLLFLINTLELCLKLGFEIIRELGAAEANATKLCELR